MSSVATIFWKDVRSYFFSMTAYILITIFLLLAGFFFSTAISYFSLYSFQISSQPQIAAAQEGLNLTEAVLGNLFLNFSVILMLMIPIVTMRSLAEEQKQGTFELLLTYPVSELEIVAGKFLALVFVFTAMLAPTGIYLVILKLVGGAFEWGVVLSSFLGLMLLGTAFLALGLFASGLTENQIVSAVVSFGFLLLLWMIAWVSEFMPPHLSIWFEQVSLVRHVEDFFKGIIQLKHICYYVLFTLFFVWLTVWRLEARRWLR